MSTLRTFNLQHPESSNNNIQLAEGGGVSVTAGILTATNVSSTNVTTTEVTATNGTFSGNLSVGGVLSYEDVTNVDAVGLSTFRNGIHVTGGNFGIGTNSPARILHASGSGTQAIRLENTAGTGNAILELKLPSSTFTTGLNPTSIYYDDTAGKEYVWYQNGTERLRITSGGDVGINRPIPSAALDVESATDQTVLRLRNNGGNNTRLLFSNKAAGVAEIFYQGDFRFVDDENSDAERLRITSNGDLMTGGITTGAGKVQVGGGLRIAGSATHTDTPSPYLYRTSGADNLCISTSALERLRITSGGDVTIGNSSVAFPSGGGLQVYNASAPRIKLTNSTTGVASGDGLQIYVSGSSAIFDHKENAEMRFYTNATEKLRITNAGVVYINQTASVGSTAKLEVTGTFNNSFPEYSFPLMVNDDAAYNSSNGPGGGIGFAFKQNSSGAWAQAGGIRGIKENTTDGNYASALLFYTRPNGVGVTERLRIDSSGDLIQGNYTKLYNKNNNHLALIAAGESTPTVYVSDSGDDSTGDGTSSSPFRTLTKAWNHVPKVFTHNQTARIMIKGTSYTVDTDYYMRGGAAGGNWQWGPAVEIRSESGSQIDVYLRRGWRFENVDGLRFNHLNFICDNANGYLAFNSCARGKIYNTCDMTVSATKGWSERVTYDNCQQFVDDMDIDVTSAASSGLGGLVVVRSKSSLSGSRYITKAGSVFGNSAVSVCDDSFVSCNWDITNFTYGFSFGLNHYNAEVGGSGMLNGVAINNCTTGIRVWNNSFVRKYSVSYSGNTTNENIQSGSFVN